MVAVKVNYKLSNLESFKNYLEDYRYSNDNSNNNTNNTVDIHHDDRVAIETLFLMCSSLEEDQLTLSKFTHNYKLNKETLDDNIELVSSCKRDVLFSVCMESMLKGEYIVPKFILVFRDHIEPMFIAAIISSLYWGPRLDGTLVELIQVGAGDEESQDRGDVQFHHKYRVKFMDLLVDVSGLNDAFEYFKDMGIGRFSYKLVFDVYDFPQGPENENTEELQKLYGNSRFLVSLFRPCIVNPKEEFKHLQRVFYTCSKNIFYLILLHTCFDPIYYGYHFIDFRPFIETLNQNELVSCMNSLINNHHCFTEQFDIFTDALIEMYHKTGILGPENRENIIEILNGCMDLYKGGITSNFSFVRRLFTTFRSELTDCPDLVQRVLTFDPKPNDSLFILDTIKHYPNINYSTYSASRILDIALSDTSSSPYINFQIIRSLPIYQSGIIKEYIIYENTLSNILIAFFSMTLQLFAVIMDCKIRTTKKLAPFFTCSTIDIKILHQDHYRTALLNDTTQHLNFFEYLLLYRHTQHFMIAIKINPRIYHFIPVNKVYLDREEYSYYKQFTRIEDYDDTNEYSLDMYNMI